ncbi:PaaI family thioesterase [Streptomyces sp. NPDC088116]|uniref:PaaI family thioesterase n=1 Tax=Streptomyces sp. NPDC088116 TaxID=3365825 RepID=UPI00382C8BF5
MSNVPSPGTPPGSPAGPCPLTPPADAVPPVRHPGAPAPGELLGSHYEHCFGCGEARPHGLRLRPRAGECVSVTLAHQGSPGPGVRTVPVGTLLHPEAGATAVHGRKTHRTATGRIGGPGGAAAVRADAFIEVTVDHFVDNGRPEEIRAAMADSDQIERARAFEVNP